MAYARRHTPVFALIGKRLLGPRLLDDPVAFLERRPVGGIDLVMLMWPRAMNPMSLLRHHIDPAALIAAREPRVGASAGHMIEHRDIFGDADRIVRRQHDTELATRSRFVCIPI